MARTTASILTPSTAGDFWLQDFWMGTLSANNAVGFQNTNTTSQSIDFAVTMTLLGIEILFSSSATVAAGATTYISPTGADSIGYRLTGDRDSMNILYAVTSDTAGFTKMWGSLNVFRSGIIDKVCFDGQISNAA